MTSLLVLPQAVYRRAKAPHELPGDLRLTALEWALYFAVTGTHTAAEIGREMRADEAARDEALARLFALELIEEQQLNASEYVRAVAATGDREEKTLVEFLVRAARPNAAAGRGGEAPGTPRQALRDGASVPHAGTSPRSAWPHAASGAASRLPRPAQPAFGFKPLPPPDGINKENRPMSGSRRLSLRALMNLIEKQAGSREAGQLDIYRVFVRVDTVLLKRSGIETLRFTEDRLVSDPELEQAIVRSVKKTLGLDCPDSIWVDVA